MQQWEIKLKMLAFPWKKILKRFDVVEKQHFSRHVPLLTVSYFAKDYKQTNKKAAAFLSPSTA
jgi:hypothetical protein